MLTFDRRALLRLALTGGALALDRSRHAVAQMGPPFRSNPFTLGVASGDPSPDGFVLWTRLAPEPLHARGGMSILPVEVTWEISENPAFATVLRSGVARAHIELGHSIHIEIGDLAPARDYFYRFRAGGVESPAGRTRTLPAPGSMPSQLRLVAAGCQVWESGYYTAWRGVADDQPDLVFHYGDYIYENAHAKLNRQGLPLPRTMPQDFPTCITLTDYRRRYGLYKTDSDLQAAHASAPFIASFDDHEVGDNWASDSDPRNTSPDAFLFRRAAAFQAWYEHMPVRLAQLPRGPDVQMYRRFAFGSLADMSVLDTRQYRSHQACGDGIKGGCGEADAPGRTMLGTAQEQWLAEGLKSSTATWQILAQQVLFAHLEWRSFPWVKDDETPAINLDAWDGASAARGRVLGLLRDAKVASSVILTGDMHRGVALDVKDDWRDPDSATRTTEFLATSISSGGDGALLLANDDKLRADNPHMKFMTDQRGYHLHTVTPKLWRADFRAVDKISQPGRPIATTRSFVVEAGQPGLKDA